METLIELGVFTSKALVIIIGFIVVIGFIAMNSLRQKAKDTIEVEDFSNKFKEYQSLLQTHTLNRKELKKELKKTLKEEKQLKKNKDPKAHKKNIFVLEFNGDMKASGVSQLRDEISAVLTTARPTDEVVVCIESPGGLVHSYGLAAAQLLRFREHNIPLTICVDKVAASGGYMMACTGDKVLAAPFAIMGSIGVVAQIPNLNKLLKKHDVEYQEITAGQYKRTLSLFGEITDEGKKKFTEQIQETHDLFKNFVKTHRPIVEIDKVATGEYWYGKQALQLKLIDELKVSDEYLFTQKDKAKIFKISIKPKKKLSERISESLSMAIDRSIERWAWTSNYLK